MSPPHTDAALTSLMMMTMSVLVGHTLNNEYISSILLVRDGLLDWEEGGKGMEEGYGSDR